MAIANPSLYSATLFRALLDALARPGTITTLPDPSLFAPYPAELSHPYALAALATLIDNETTFALARDGVWLGADHPIARWLTLRTRATMAPPSAATFALLSDAASLPLVVSLDVGTLPTPELATTAFCMVEQLSSETSAHMIPLTLSGPGIATNATLAVAGLTQAGYQAIQSTRAHYPLGIDLFLITPDGSCAGLPRTTVIAEVTQWAM